ncbi:MAG TPA: DUF2249 domain-containing protein [Candidatus Desulfobacillus sp.]|nr:DUF2249 domain-containing protein [Candidatus Desulfobacillus sp.]
MGEARVIDGRAMAPPEPMEKTLSALQTLPDGEALTLLLRGKPFPLYAILKTRGFSHDTQTRPDGTVEVRIWKG